jgi:AcrR family transcriptional regulator
MAAHGYDGTSLQSVADAVGIRKPSLLYHFSSKETLRRGVLEQVLSRWNDVLPRIFLASTQDGVARFDAVMAEVTSFFGEEPDRARLLIRELLDRPDDMRSYVRDYVRPWLAVITKFIRAGQRSKEIHDHVDPDLYVLDVMTLILGGWATYGILRAALSEEPNGDEARSRYLAELIRIAKTSLFTPAALEAVDE